MKNLIKQILQEEIDDLGWIHEVNPEKAIVEYIENKIETIDYQHMANWDNKRIRRWFQEMEHSLTTLIGDAEKMVEYAKDVNNEKLNSNHRLEALNSYQDYSSTEMVVEDVRGALLFFGDFIDNYKLPLYRVLDYASRYYGQK